jgi:hypothetical protein
MLLAAAEAPSRFEVAAPFIASLILLILGPFVGIGVEYRLRDVLARWRDDDELCPAVTERLVSYHPDTVAKSSLWAIDAAQIFATFLPPLLGIALLRPGLALFMLYLAASVAVIAGYLAFLFLVPVDRYHVHGKWIFSPVPLIGIPITGGAAIAAALIGP